MNKFNLIIMTPMFLDIMIIFIMMLPSKNSKFHPISLLMILIFLTFLICLKMNFFNKLMIPFILFLTMIGGLMVIYMYIMSLSNNELFNFNLKFLLINFMKITPLLMIYFFMIYKFNQIIMMNNNINLLSMNNKILNSLDNLYLNSMYKEIMNKSSYFIMIYLFYSMICIMNICFKFKAPLRQMSF